MCNFVGEMENGSMKGRIDEILIREKRYRDPGFSAGELAKMLGVSGWKLSRTVRKVYGMGYAEVVHGCRIKDAMHLLRDGRYGDCSVDDIGRMVGFGNRQSFFSAFKKLVGMTPERYRKN